MLLVYILKTLPKALFITILFWFKCSLPLLHSWQCKQNFWIHNESLDLIVEEYIYVTNKLIFGFVLIGLDYNSNIVKSIGQS